MLTWIKGFFVHGEKPTESRNRIAPENRIADSVAQETVKRHKDPNFRDTLFATVDEAENQQPQVISLRVKLPAKTSDVCKPVQSNNLVRANDGIFERSPRKKPNKNSVQLNEFHFASRAQLRTLAAAGIINVGDLRNCKPKDLIAAKRFPKGAYRWLKEGRQILRLFVTIRALRPIDATILFMIHRSTPASLADEQPIRLYRDIQRFLLSSAGSQLLGKSKPPTQARVNIWVRQAKRVSKT